MIVGVDQMILLHVVCSEVLKWPHSWSQSEWCWFLSGAQLGVVGWDLSSPSRGFSGFLVDWWRGSNRNSKRSPSAHVLIKPPLLSCMSQSSGQS